MEKTDKKPQILLKKEYWIKKTVKNTRVNGRLKKDTN